MSTKQSCWIFLLLLALAVFSSAIISIAQSRAERKGPIVLLEINGPINPATDDYLKTGIKHGVASDARLIVLKLNTPGGLVVSMQSMVQNLLDSPIPVVVYVSPSGGSATSAGVFITMSGHIAAMAPGTTIGAAHPVEGGGQDLQGDMRAKLENFAVSLIKAIAEQRSRNVKWAEQAVRDSVSITDREAVQEKVVDISAADLESLLEQVEGKTVTVQGAPVTLTGLKDAPRSSQEMSFKQKVINILSDPNIAILLGLAAMVGLGIEFTHPGVILPGIVGAACLILALGSMQVLPIDYTGLGLLLLGGIFFLVELFVPTFGVWGVSGLVCMVLGAIYLIDEDSIYGFGNYSVDRLLVGGVAAAMGSVLMGVTFLAVNSRRAKVSTGSEGLVGKRGVIKRDFTLTPAGVLEGKVGVHGELWRARLERDDNVPPLGGFVTVVRVESGMILIVRSGE